MVSHCQEDFQLMNSIILFCTLCDCYGKQKAAGGAAKIFVETLVLCTRFDALRDVVFVIFLVAGDGPLYKRSLCATILLRGTAAAVRSTRAPFGGESVGAPGMTETLRVLPPFAGLDAMKPHRLWCKLAGMRKYDRITCPTKSALAFPVFLSVRRRAPSYDPSDDIHLSYAKLIHLGRVGDGPGTFGGRGDAIARRGGHSQTGRGKAFQG